MFIAVSCYPGCVCLRSTLDFGHAIVLAEEIVRDVGRHRRQCEDGSPGVSIYSFVDVPVQYSANRADMSKWEVWNSIDGKIV